MRSSKRPFLVGLTLLASAICLLVGCVTPFDFAANAGLGVAQAGTSSFIQGTLQAAFDKPMEKVFEASRRAYHRLGYEITREDVGTHYAQLQGSQSDGSSIIVKLRKSSETVTGLSIRVGLWGDNAVSRLILEEIEKELASISPEEKPHGEAAPSTPPAG
ncbi:MAG: DUF3568 family protein [Phycisphaeraceae bacterium]|nr:DUF3568 family protein [Phycisphaeraceae bacterium]